MEQTSKRVSKQELMTDGPETEGDRLAGDNMKTLPKQLTKYKEVLARKQNLEDRLSNVEEGKGTVADNVYFKVRGEYLGKLEHVNAELAELQGEMREFCAQVAAEIKVIIGESNKQKDKLEEIAFRNRVGEFSEEKLFEMETPIRNEMKKLIMRRSELEKTLDHVG